MAGFEPHEPVLSIGLAAERSGVAVPTLRLYEAEGLIIPYKTETNRRLFSSEDLERIECLRKLIHEEGLNFAGIRWLLSALPCWELGGCPECDVRPKLECATFSSTGEPCWVVMRRLGKKTDEDCRNCPVYRSAHKRVRRLRKIVVQVATSGAPSSS